MRPRIVRAVDAIAALLAAIGAVFLAYVTLAAEIDLAAVRTGPIVAAAGAALFVGTLLLLIGLALVIWALFRHPGSRLRAAGSLALGLALFAACVIAAELWTESKRPPRVTSAEAWQGFSASGAASRPLHES